MDTARTMARSRPPGPPIRRLSGHLREFRRDRLGFLEHLAHTYGDVVSFRLGPYPAILLNHPELMQQVLVTDHRSFRKHFAVRQRTRKTLGRGLLTSEGDFWRRQRRLAQPAFHRERLRQYADLMVGTTERTIASWRPGQLLDIHAAMMRLTLEIVSGCLFGADLSEESAHVSQAMEEMLVAFSRQVGRLLLMPDFVPTPGNLRLQRAIGRLDAIIYRLVADRRATGRDHGDLLSMLIRATDDEDGQRMTDRQLRDELMTLFMAGHETTASALAWTFFLLDRNREADETLARELERELGDRPATIHDVSRLTFTRSVIDESMRLYPPAWLLGREAIAPVMIGGFPVPIGTTVYISPWLLHRDPRWFENPFSFRPERWSSPSEESRSAFVPFGLGPRMCIGHPFASMEMVLTLATIARRYRVELSPEAQVEPMPTMTLRPRHGIPVLLCPR